MGEPFFPTTNLASYEALPRLSYSPVFFSPVFLCLPSEADASIFHISYSVSLFLAEVTQVKGFLPFPYSFPIRSGLTRCMRLSSVKVPRPASPYITHETPLCEGTAVAVSRGNG
jgi:hypothetical protein